MGWDTPFVRTVAGVASALLLLLGVVGAGVVKPDSKKKHLVAVVAKQAPAGVEAQGSGGGGAVSGTPGAPAAQPAPAQAAPVPAANAQPAPAPAPAPIKANPSPSQKQPGPVTPPKAGTYTYKGSQGDSTAKVENDGGANGVVRQAITMSSGQGSLRSEVAWGPSDVTWESSALTGPQGSGSCDWKPPVKQYSVPLSTGTNWSYDSTCAGTANGVSFSFHRVGTAKVTGVSTFNVGGTDVITWVIERHETIDFTVGLQSNHGETTSTEQFSPDHGLIVHQVTSATGSDQPTEITLASLNPS
jgi:hypothetical protein